jgi:hypothetical protein
MSNVSKFKVSDSFTGDELDVLDDLPSSNELRCMAELVGDAAEPVARLVRALENAERQGRTAYLVMVDPHSQSPVEPLIASMLPDRPPEIPSRAAVLQARRNAEARMELLREFGFLTAEEIAKGRSRAANRSAMAGRWRSEGRIFSVEWKGRALYPGFQFDEQGAPLPIVARVLAALPRDRMSEWEVALWWTSANGWLSGARPVDRIHDPEQRPLIDAAQHLAEPSPL